MYSATYAWSRRYMGVGGQHHAPAALPPGERHGIHCTWGWVSVKAGLDVCGKKNISCPQGHWSPGPPSP